MPSRRLTERPAVLVIGLFTVLLATHSASAMASDQLLMRATCGNDVVTAGEGTVPGYGDYVALSSVHHELTRQFNPPGPVQQSPIRVVKSVSASTVRLMERMMQGTGCEEVIIVHLRSTPPSGALQEYWELVLDNAALTERKNWDVTGAIPVQDAISFVPAIVTWTFTDAAGGPVQFSWNFETNLPAGATRD
jgi:type VI protein secretion system component Hcp